MIEHLTRVDGRALRDKASSRVHDFHTRRPSELRISVEPEAIPGGFMTTFEDQSGNTIYGIDQSEDAAASETD